MIELIGLIELIELIGLIELIELIVPESTDIIAESRQTYKNLTFLTPRNHSGLFLGPITGRTASLIPTSDFMHG